MVLPSETRAWEPDGALDLELVDIPAGTFVMGDAAGEADEAPRTVSVAGFRLTRTEVTNARFAAFVAMTGHRTDPERSGWGEVARRGGPAWRRLG